MSKRLRWKAAEEPQYLHHKLLIALRRRFTKIDIDFVMSEDDVHYVHGLIHGGTGEARELLPLLKRYGTIRIWEEEVPDE